MAGLFRWGCVMPPPRGGGAAAPARMAYGSRTVVADGCSTMGCANLTCWLGAGWLRGMFENCGDWGGCRKWPSERSTICPGLAITTGCHWWFDVEEGTWPCPPAGGPCGGAQGGCGWDAMVAIELGGNGGCADSGGGGGAAGHGQPTGGGWFTYAAGGGPCLG